MRPSVPVLCPGGTVVCLGSGPSLTPEDVEACRGRATVIAVNDTHRLAPWADVLYSSDQRWWNFYQGVPTFPGLKFGIRPFVAKPEWAITVLENTGDAGIETEPTGLRNGRNSGYAAINLAIHLGASRIVLLGYDMGYTRRGASHFFGDHPERLRADSPYQTFLAMFAALPPLLAQLGVEVINCSRQTALEVFPRAGLAEGLE